ncbi:MAG: hypothetical protein QOF60_1564 [Actinomycetota bacterium]|jgi:hypothetical protein|nr:hypothetical protein [Actinomycetota bacterium]
MTDISVVKLVIRLLGGIAIGLGLALFLLIWKLVQYQKPPEASEVALVGFVASGFTGSLGYIGGLLTTTHTDSSAPSPSETPVASDG